MTPSYGECALSWGECKSDMMSHLERLLATENPRCDASRTRLTNTAGD
jgi:hypothetical protein